MKLGAQICHLASRTRQTQAQSGKPWPSGLVGGESLWRRCCRPYNADSLQPDGQQSPGSCGLRQEINPQDPVPFTSSSALKNYDQIGRSSNYIRQFQSDINPRPVKCDDCAVGKRFTALEGVNNSTERGSDARLICACLRPLGTANPCVLDEQLVILEPHPKNDLPVAMLGMR